MNIKDHQEDKVKIYCKGQYKGKNQEVNRK